MIYDEIKIDEYFGSGNYLKFIKDYGRDVYNDIINRTSSLNNGYRENKKFTARLLFLNKYGGNINKIIKNDKIKKFNGKDFFEASDNNAEKQWKILKTKIDSIEVSNLYSLPETIELLLINGTYLNYLGKSKNRTIQKHNLLLYLSIIFF